MTQSTLTDGTTSYTTHYTVDDRDRITSVTEADGQTSTIEYNHAVTGCGVRDLPTKKTAPDGTETKFEYDARQRLTKVIDPLNGNIQYEYNARGDLISLTDPNSHKTEFTYDGNRRLIQKKTPSLKTDWSTGVTTTTNEITNYKYDADGKLTREEKVSASTGNVYVTQNTYDQLGRLSRRVQKVETPAGVLITTDDDSNYQYSRQIDGISLTEATNAGVKIEYYDNDKIKPFLPKAAKVSSNLVGNPWGVLEFDHSYALEYTDTLYYLIDTASQNYIMSYGLPLSNSVYSFLSNYFGSEAREFSSTYDAFLRKTQLTGRYDSNSQTDYSFDSAGRLASTVYKHFTTAPDYDTLMSETLTYGTLSRNLTQVNRGSVFGIFTYGYDNNHQLTSVQFTDGSTPQYLGSLVSNRSWSYDANGSRSTDSQLSGTASITANALTSTAAFDYYYDPHGFGRIAGRKAKGTHIMEIFDYRVDGKLTHYMKFNDLNDNRTFDTGESLVINVYYFYDALDRRISKKISNPSESYYQSYAYYGQEDRIYFAKNGDGEEYWYLDGLNEVDEHYGQMKITSSSTREWNDYITDHLGSVLNGEAAAGKMTFGAHGESLASVAAISSSQNPVIYGFAGRQLDPETGLYYNRARMYDPALGRFTTRDPIGFDGGDSNLYRYVKNSPQMARDPAGLYPDDPAYIPGPAGTAGALPGPYNQGLNLGLALGTGIGFGVVATPALVGSLGTLGSAALNACLMNPALCNHVVASGGVGFISGLINGIDSSKVKIPGFLNSNGVYMNQTTANAYGAGEFLGYLLGKGINACPKKP